MIDPEEYSVCERIAEDNFSNPIYQDVLNKIALAEEALEDAKRHMMATVKLIDSDEIVQVIKRKQLAKDAAERQRSQQAALKHRENTIELFKELQKEYSYKPELKHYPIEDSSKIALAEASWIKRLFSKHG